MLRRAWGLAFPVSLVIASASGVANAEEPPAADPAVEARQEYHLGTQAFSQKRYSDAALHFEAAAALKANAVALYTAALAWDFASKSERAADAYARSLDVPGLDAKQSAVAKDRLAALEKSLGTVAITAPEGWKVQLDNFTEVNAPARIHAAPGVHPLTVRSTSRASERREVTLEAGKVERLDLKDEVKVVAKVDPEPVESSVAPRLVDAPVTPPAPFWNTYRIVGVGVTSVGITALASGIVFGLQANDAKDTYGAAPTRSAFDHASSLQTWTNVSLVVGGLFLASGIALVVVPIGKASRHRVTVGATPGGMIASGMF